MWAVWACLLAVVAASPQPLHLERDSFRRPAAAAWQKRLVAGAHPVPEDFAAFQHHHLPPQVDDVNSQLMLRSPRGQRQYDVPQIG
ncbi:hypothetical protein JTB14_000841 [Gonioctena quinquepunctata]|nr:hypothetical protein JTB14_000841 [Gonioctena quinquepunctata]